MSPVALCASMFFAGLAGSLHCVGMCGPLVLGFARGGARAGSAAGFGWYHVGRVWTYALLGLVAGAFGERVLAGAAWVGWQRVASLGLSTLVLAVAVALLWLGPGLAGGGWVTRCALPARGPLQLLGGTAGAGGRFVLGAIMGFLPCGLVYAMLALAAATANPVAASLGMAAFGLGTVPALTGVLLATGFLPVRLRAQGTRLAAVALLATGAWMMARSLAVSPREQGCPMCVPTPGSTTEPEAGRGADGSLSRL